MPDLTPPGAEGAGPTLGDVAAPIGGAPPLDLTGAGTGFAPSAAAGFGGTASGSTGVFNVIGDMPNLRISPRIVRRSRVGGNQFPPIPPVPPPPGPPTDLTALPNPEIRSLKIAENQSPLPQDRVFFSFNYFDNFGKIYNDRDNNGISNMTVYQEVFGFEKTFFDRNASIGFRLPLNSLAVTSNIPNFDDTQTALGSLNIFMKYILSETVWSDGDAFYLTGGLSVTPPTGPRNFASYGGLNGFKSTYLQPFIGYLFTRGPLYFQGFSAVEVPVGTGDNDVTFFYNDVALGYILLNRRDDPGRFVTAVAPTMEAHVNTPLNHRGVRNGDPASSPDQVILTWGLNTELRRRSIVTVGYATPIVGPNTFDGEFILQLNFFFGGRRGLTDALLTPPVL